MKCAFGLASVALLLSACGQISSQEPGASVKTLPDRYSCMSTSNDGISHTLLVSGFASNGNLIPSRLRFSLNVGGTVLLSGITPRVTTAGATTAGFVYDAQGYQVQFDVSSNGVGQPGIMGGIVRYANGRIVSLPSVTCRAR